MDFEGGGSKIPLNKWNKEGKIYKFQGTSFFLILEIWKLVLNEYECNLNYALECPAHWYSFSWFPTGRGYCWFPDLSIFAEWRKERAR